VEPDNEDTSDIQKSPSDATFLVLYHGLRNRTFCIEGMKIESLGENLSKFGASSRHLKILYLIYTTGVEGGVLHQRDLLQLPFIVIYSILYHTHSK
jgi:hypothetical protein